MFGRWEDIETIFIFTDGKDLPTEVFFPGTYSGTATWYAKVPQHLTRAIPYKSFELFGVHRALPAGGLSEPPQIRVSVSAPDPRSRRASGPPPPIVVWCNTWNHAFAEANTNESMKLVYRHPMPSLEAQHLGEECTRYPLCVGSRAEVDARFGGLVKSFVKTKRAEDVARLGARLL